MRKIIFLCSIFSLSASYAFASPDVNKAKEFISEFYKQYVFSGSLYQVDVNRIGTPRFWRKLERAYIAEYDCDDSPCYAVWELRTGAQDGQGKSIVSKIQPKSDGWYRVSYRDMGWKGTTDVKVVEVNGIIKLDDYKRISDNINVGNIRESNSDKSNKRGLVDTSNKSQINTKTDKSMSNIAKLKTKNNNLKFIDSSCACSGYNVCYGPRGGKYCITSGGNKRYVK